VIYLKKKIAKGKPREKDETALPSLSLVFGYIAVKELRRTEDRVVVLSRLGYGNAEIAKICGTTENTVAALKWRARRRRRRE
jgi:DNA-binding CsgD family transcriptional regulator